MFIVLDPNDPIPLPPTYPPKPTAPPKKSTTTTTTPPPNDCTDMYPNCSDMKAKYYCRLHADWMNQHCCASCQGEMT